MTHIDKGYRNATNVNTGGWSVTDKIFSYLDKAGHIYNQIRYPQPGQSGYVDAQVALRQQQAGMFGLPKPWGFVLLVAVAGGVVWGVSSLVKK
jgi:hypothetical protein